MKFISLLGKSLLLSASVFFSGIAVAQTNADQCITYSKAQDYGRAAKAGQQAVRDGVQTVANFNCLGSAFSVQANYENALLNFKKAEKLGSSSPELLRTYQGIGEVYRLTGDLSSAMNYFQRFIYLARDLRNRGAEADGLNDLANVMSARGNNDKALEYYYKSLDLNSSDLDKAVVYNNIGAVFLDLGDAARAEANFDKAIALSRRSGDTKTYALAQRNRGCLLADVRNFPPARDSLSEAATSSRKTGFRRVEVASLRCLSTVEKEQGNLDNAITLLNDAIALAKASQLDGLVGQYQRELLKIKSIASSTQFSVIEIGSKGVKAAAIVATRDEKGRPTYKTSFKKSVNTNLIEGVAETGEYSEEAMQKTISVILTLKAMLDDASGPVKNQIFAFGSSGVAMAVNRDEFADRVQRETGLKLRFITSAEEMSYALKGSLDDSLLYKSVLLDIGSGNSRLGYLVSPRNGQPEGKVVIDVPAGSVSLVDMANKARKPGESFTDALNRTVIDEFESKFAKEAKSYPKLAVHSYWTMVGGASWAAATLLYPENQGDYVQMKSQDLAAYYDRLVANPELVMNPDLSKISDEKVRASAQAQVNQVKKVFSLENILAGARLLKMVAQNSNSGKAEIYFARDGNWAYGMAESFAENKMR